MRRYVKELQSTWGVELKRHKSQWDGAERAARDAWEADKTREVKELTIRGLEPEVQRLVQKHRAEVRDVQAGAHTRPHFSSTSAISVGQGVHLGVV